MLLVARAAPAAELGAADDAYLNHGDYASLASMKAHGVGSVRLMVYTGRDDSSQFEAARRAHALGLGVQVVLSPYYGEMPDAAFPGWVAAKARQYAPYANRFSILNEPDLWLPVADACDEPAEAAAMVAAAATTSSTRVVEVQVTRRVPTPQWVKRDGWWVKLSAWRKLRSIERGGWWAQLRAWRKLRRRGVVARRPAYRVRRYTATRVVREARGVPVSRTTPGRACRAIARARVAQRTWQETVPLVRSADPGAEVLVGETSPVAGCLAFAAEAMRLGLPAVDGWAHHPYPILDTWPYRTPECAVERAETLSDAVRLPMYWTEFGVPIRAHHPSTTPELAQQLWQAAMAKGAQLGVRQVVAYGWRAAPHGYPWDTAAEGVLWGSSASPPAG